MVHMRKLMTGLMAVLVVCWAACAGAVCADAVVDGAEFRWSNAGRAAATFSSVEAPIAASHFSLFIPPAPGRPPGTRLRVKEVRFASVHKDLTPFDEKSSTPCDPTYLLLNGVVSDPVDATGTILSATGTVDRALAFRFSEPCFLSVGSAYRVDASHSFDRALTFLSSEKRPLHRYGRDISTCRFIRMDCPMPVISTPASEFCPVFEFVGEICETDRGGTATWEKGSWSRPPKPGDHLVVKLQGETRVELAQSLFARSVELVGDGRLVCPGGRLIVDEKLIVRGHSRADSVNLRFRDSDVLLEKDASLVYEVGTDDRQFLNAISGPGRFVQRGNGELTVTNARGGLPRVGGGLKVCVENGFLMLDGDGGPVLLDDVELEATRTGLIVSHGELRLEGRVTLVSDDEFDRSFFANPQGRLTRLRGRGTLVAAGRGRIELAANLALAGELVADCPVSVRGAMLELPASVSGEGSIAIGGRSAWAAQDGLLAHHLLFNGMCEDIGVRPLKGENEGRLGRFITVEGRRAMRLSTRRPESTYWGENAATGSGDFTLIISARTESRAKAIVFSLGDGSGRAFGLRTSDDEGNVELVVWKGGQVARRTAPARVEGPTKSFHAYSIVYRADEQTLSFAVDGTSVGTLDYVPDDSRTRFQFGSVYGGVKDGESQAADMTYVGEFWLYRRALSPERLLTLYGPPAPAVTVVYQERTLSFTELCGRYPFRLAAVTALLVLIPAVLIARQQRTRQAVRAQRMFFSIVSHDIRTPLNAIIGYSDMLKAKLMDPSERETAVGSINRSARMLLQLINDILDLSKLESGRMAITREPTDLAGLVRDILAEFHALAAAKGLRLVEDVAPSPPVMIDPHRCRQILFNFLGNALKFTDTGSVTVRVRAADGRVSFAVQDTGIGISEEDVRRLLRPFEQTREGMLRGGAGLGLSICKTLAEKMHGRLAVASTLGKGTTFELFVPAESASAASSPSEAVVAATAVPLPRKVLFVDDSPVNRAVGRAMLTKLGVAEVVLAENGQEALAKLDGSFDFVFTDLWMPVMNGEAFVKAVRADPRWAELPVYVLTADVDAQKNYREAGFSGIILKPITLDGMKAFFGVA